MKILSLLIVLLGLTFNASALCPKFVFYCDNPNRCDGTVDISMTMCNNGITDPISLDYVVWNMGNGFSDTTTSLEYSYTYGLGGTYGITATVYCMVGTQRCIVQALILAAGTTPENICTAATGGTTLYVPVVVFDFSLYVSTPTMPTQLYTTTPVTVSAAYTGNLTSADYNVYIDGLLQTPYSGSGTFPNPIFSGYSFLAGQHQVEMVIQDKGTACTFSRNLMLEVLDNTEVPECSTCFTFRPMAGERYWFSAWVKVDVPSAVKTYNGLFSYVRIDYTGNTSTQQIHPTGPVIEGWQQISGSITVPTSPAPTEMKISLYNGHGTYDSYFDDVRIHPYNASMKSYVHDASTFWLVAELDENNFATFYEYDKEGKLIRIKKETEDGVHTIQ